MSSFLDLTGSVLVKLGLQYIVSATSKLDIIFITCIQQLIQVKGLKPGLLLRLVLSAISYFITTIYTASKKLTYQQVHESL